MKIKYTGPAKDFSGYGECSRHDIASLVKVGIDVTTEIPVYTPQFADYGKLGEIAVERENKDIGYAYKILHTTPNVYKQHMEFDKYHIGRAFWETDKVPLDFAQNLNIVDEIWTGSKFNEQAIRNAGVTKPKIHIIPEAIDDSLNIDEVKPFLTDADGKFKFYSIFEWTERKNPGALLEAYWKAFEGKNDVALIIKTYVDNFKPEKKKEIDTHIRKIKARLNLTHYADVYLYRNLMDRRHIYRFHKTGDCFVSLHRGEGWGIPQMEALLMEKPIISTNCGGVHEYLTNKKTAYLLPYTMTQVKNTRNQKWYTPDQKWAQVDVEEAIKAMKYVYKNKEKAKAVGKAGRKRILEVSSLESVGKKMKERLYAINKERISTL